MRAALVAVAIAASARVAAAQPSGAGSAAPPPPPSPPPATHPDDVPGAPVPGAEAGRTDVVDGGDGTAREIARGLLWPLKFLFEIVAAPARGVIWLDDRFHVSEWYRRLFYYKNGTLAVVPVVEYMTGWGITGGARVVASDVFGAREKFVIDGLFGGAFQQRASIWFDTGRRFSRVTFGVGANVDRRPADPFYGIGNGDVGAKPTTLVDPVVNPTAYPTDFRYQELRASTQIDVRAVSRLHAIARGALTAIEYGPGEHGDSIDTVFDVATVPGFTQGVRHAYGELELRWDGRTPGNMWDPPHARASGELASVFAGRVHRLDGAPDFWHVGFEVQEHLRLGTGPRVLSLRWMGEGVTGNINDVPFTELPYLGGDILRGYPYARFRDRVSLFGSVQYTWDIAQFADAYAFVDYGRVFPALDQLALADWRLGYGVGILLHPGGAFAAEASIATSIDGGFFASIALNPILDVRPRWR